MMRRLFTIFLFLLSFIVVRGQSQPQTIFGDLIVWGNVKAISDGLSTEIDSSSMVYLYVDSINIGGVVLTPASPIFGTISNDSIYLAPTYLDHHYPYRLYADSVNHTFTLTNDITESSMQIGRELWGRCINTLYDTVHEGTVVTGITGIAEEAVLVKYRPLYDYTVNKMLGLATSNILQGEEGEVATYGRTHGIDTRQYGRNKILYITNDTSDKDGLTEIRPAWPDPAFIAGITLDSAEDGTVYTVYRHDGIFYQFDGTAIQQQDGSVVVDGGNIYYDVELKGGGDLPMQLYSQVVYLDCTTGDGVDGKARVQLTAGTKTSPQFNTVYVTMDEDRNAILKSTTGYPRDIDSIFALISYVVVWDAYTTATYGPKLHQLTTDAINHNNRGKIPYIDERLRELGASYKSGIDFESTVRDEFDPDSVSFTHNNGIALQLHRHVVPSFDVKEQGIHIANHPTVPDTVVYDLSDPELLQTADGTSLSGQYFNWVVWGAINKDTTEYKLFINLPVGSYGSAADAIADPDNTAVTTIDTDMKGVGFLICRLPYRHRTLNSGTYTNLATSELDLQGIDLRGVTLGYNLSSSGVPASSTFNDDDFEIQDATDNTKVIKFEAGDITTGTTRTITVPDSDGELLLWERVRHGSISLSASESPQKINFSPAFNSTEYTLQINSYTADGLTVFPIRGTWDETGFNVTVNFDCIIDYIAIEQQ